MSESPRLIELLKRLSGSLLAIFQTRLDLLSNEVEEERLRIEQRVLYGSMTLFLFGLAIILMTAFIVVLFWDGYRLLVLGGLTALFCIAGLLMLNVLRRMTPVKSKLFSASLAELASDRDWLNSRP